jgi:hypothetical protein
MFVAVASAAARAQSASDVLPADLMKSGKPLAEPVTNSAFIPEQTAAAAPDFCGVLKIAQTTMQTKPALKHPMQDGRDARLFPGVTLEFFTMDGMLVPVQRGEMVRETAPGKVASYWRVIPQFGRVWKESTMTNGRAPPSRSCWSMTPRTTRIRVWQASSTTARA